MFFKLLFSVLNDEWIEIEYETNAFFNEKNGVKLHIVNNEIRLSFSETEEIPVSRSSIISFFLKREGRKQNKRLVHKERKQRKKEEEQRRKEEKQNKQLLKEALKRNFRVNIVYDETKTLNEVIDWLEEKKYNFGRQEKKGFPAYEDCFYFSNKEHATEFKLSWG